MVILSILFMPSIKFRPKEWLPWELLSSTFFTSILLLLFLLFMGHELK